MRRWLTRIALVVAGLSAGALLVEVGMRTAGAVIRARQQQRNYAALREKHDVRVVCLGESTTEGEPGRRSYPEMLEEILNREQLGIRFAVVNKGMSGATTRQLLEMFRWDLDAIDPDVVVAMMGVNDAGRTHAWGSVLEPGRGHWYGEWRLYKLYRFLRSGFGWAPPPPRLVEVQGLPASRQPAEATAEVARPTPPGESAMRRVDAVGRLLAEQRYRRALEAARALRARYPDFDIPLVLEARALRRLGRADEADRLVIAALDAMPGAGAPLYADAALVLAERGDEDQAIAAVREAVARADPRLPHEQIHYRLELARLLDRAGRQDAAVEVYREIAEDVRLGDDVAYQHLIDYLERIGRSEEALAYRRLQRAMRHEYVNPDTRQQYGELAGLAVERGMTLLAVQYPVRRVDGLRRLLAQHREVRFVDNSGFAALVARNGYDAYFIDRFAGDFGHLTELGNCVLATRVAASLAVDWLGADLRPGSRLAAALAGDGCAVPGLADTAGADQPPLHNM